MNKPVIDISSKLRTSTRVSRSTIVLFLLLGALSAVALVRPFGRSRPPTAEDQIHGDWEDAAGAPGYTQTPAVGREVGQAFPNYVLPGLDGKRAISLSKFRGKKVILIEFASW